MADLKELNASNDAVLFKATADINQAYESGEISYQEYCDRYRAALIKHTEARHKNEDSLGVKITCVNDSLGVIEKGTRI